MSLYEEELWEEEHYSYFTFDECKTGHADDHWYRTPRCQKVITESNGDWREVPRVCNETFEVFEHNDIVNLDVMHLKHELEAAEVLTDENTRRHNNCRGYINHDWQTDEAGERIRDEKCDCRCHWGVYYVNVYEVDRAWGGAEEGGWWYDTGIPVASVPFETLREAEAYHDAMEERFPNDHSSSSVIYAGGDYHVYIERSFARPYPERRPHYE